MAIKKHSKCTVISYALAIMCVVTKDMSEKGNG